MKPVIIITIAFVLIIPVGIAYGDISDGRYFCNPDNVHVEKAMYEKEVIDFNGALEFYKTTNPRATEKEIADYMIGVTQKYDINSMAKCLAETHGVDLDTVAEFSPDLKEVYANNLEALYAVAPDLVEHADVPEFGNVVMLILTTSIISVIIFARKFQVIK